MANIYVISDPHFHHRNMALRRGFTDEIEMNEHIVSKWNKTVNKKDTVWILGDITMEKADYEILNKLNGIKHIVLGNHDRGQHTKILQQYVNKICGMVDYKNVILTHCPIHPSQLEFRYSKNIHGHVHSNPILDLYEDKAWGKLDERYVNVSAEAINYTPILLNQLCND
jgi:calcineurin-like phosphoesterase family protein